MSRVVEVVPLRYNEGYVAQRFLEALSASQFDDRDQWSRNHLLIDDGADAYRHPQYVFPRAVVAHQGHWQHDDVVAACRWFWVWTTRDHPGILVVSTSLPWDADQRPLRELSGAKFEVSGQEIPVPEAACLWDRIVNASDAGLMYAPASDTLLQSSELWRWIRETLARGRGDGPVAPKWVMEVLQTGNIPRLR